MKLAATIGFFDGVHRGHRFLLSQLRATAEREGLESAVVTFREHPKMLLTGQSPALLTTTEERLRLLSQTGIDHLICLDFAAVQQLTAEAFMRLLHEQYGVDILLMGYDHRFGSDRLIAIDDYIALLAEYIARLRPGIILERFVSQSPPGMVVAPRWGVKSQEFARMLDDYMEQADLWQGKNYLRSEMPTSHTIGISMNGTASQGN